ncbi:MAG: DUF6184 family natural product biosynthesis lipoprotein [Myxococcaceae bacterium]
MKNLSLVSLLVGSLALGSSCLSVEGARETGAQRSCQFEDKCGNIGSGKRYANFGECMTDKRADYQSLWPSDRCQGRIDAQNFDTCMKAVDNTRCNDLLDAINTVSKCSSSSVCTAGSSGGCNCANGQTCCNNACVNLQTDRNNCGACGTTCGSSVSCQSGNCR